MNLLQPTYGGLELQGDLPRASADELREKGTPCIAPSLDMAMRSTGVGASESAALVGLNPYMGPFEVYLRKIGQSVDSETHHTRRGRYLEPALRAWASDILSIPFAPSATLRHPEAPRVLATPDGVAPSATLEVKAPGHRTWHEWGEGDNAPDWYICQVAQQMAVTGATTGYLCALIDGDLRVYRYERDHDLEGVLLEAIDKFWRHHVVRQEPPPLDGTKAATEYLRQRFPRSTGRMMVADPRAEELMCQLREARRCTEDAERAEATLKCALQEIIGDCDGVESPSVGKILWRSSKDREHIDLERLRTDMPDVVSRYTTTTPGYRSFRTYFKGSPK